MNDRPMLALAAFTLLAGFSPAAPVHVRLAGFEPAGQGLPAGWRTWAPRPEIRPRIFLDAARGRTGKASLAISGDGNAAAYGGWEYDVPGIELGKWYRFTAWYRASGLTWEPVQVRAELRWTTAEGKAAGIPNFPIAATPQGGWTRLSLDVPAPARAASVTLRLLLANAPAGAVWWDEIGLDEIAPPAARPVTVATLKFQPRNLGTAAETVRRCIEAIDRTVPGRTDLIVLGETITWAGVRGAVLGPAGRVAGIEDVAEPVPGPTTERLGAVARARKTYLAAGVVERDGPAIYNTAVLIDRQGRVAGKYRKVNVPFSEAEAGFSPGSGYPVFDTDFGRVGMMICWDSAFPEPARELARQGAEIIVLPIWSGVQELVRARALENRVFLAASSYGYDPSLVLDPNGAPQAAASRDGEAAVATIDLNRRYDQPALGNVRERLVREGRVTPAGKPPGFVH